MERYKEIIPNFDEFKKTINSPKPYDIRVNNIKSSKKEVQNFLEKKNIEYKQRKWNENFFKVKHKPGKTLAHWLGYYYVQESTSGIPPLVLNPKQNDKILDMCAAPGSKTTQISAMMKNKGEILANDVRQNRVRGLLSNIYRIGSTNVIVTERDGRNLPETPKFDKILLDVPCSAEGNVREKEELKDGAELHRIKSISKLQEQLLEKAFRMCKEGGEIVYSTCTFSPEENELNVKKFLDKGKLIDLEFNFPYSNGITEWDSEKLDDRLRKCVRIYPHHLNSGGIFIAKFKK